MVEQKKVFLRKSCFTLSKERFVEFLVSRCLIMVGIIFKRYKGVSYLRDLSENLIFLKPSLSFKDSKPKS